AAGPLVEQLQDLHVDGVDFCAQLVQRQSRRTSSATQGRILIHAFESDGLAPLLALERSGAGLQPRLRPSMISRGAWLTMNSRSRPVSNRIRTRCLSPDPLVYITTPFPNWAWRTRVPIFSS